MTNSDSSKSSATAGQRFSLAYGRSGEPTSDSPRMRMRFAALIENERFFSDAERSRLGGLLQSEQGVDVIPYAGGYSPSGTYYRWRQALVGINLSDVLDLVTTALPLVPLSRRGEWLSEIRRIFAEEHVRYRVDEGGGVRFAIDEGFELNRAATIAALGDEKYAATAAVFDRALHDLSNTPPRGKDAIRGVFSAAEGLFKLMFNTGQLGAPEIDNYLRPVVEKRFTDAAARGAGLTLVRGFREWVASAHSYRHEPNHAEPNEPPLELAVLLVSTGAGWIRWLAEIDQSAST